MALTKHLSCGASVYSFFRRLFLLLLPALNIVSQARPRRRKLQVFVVFARKQIALVIFVLFWKRDKQRMVEACLMADGS